MDASKTEEYRKNKVLRTGIIVTIIAIITLIGLSFTYAKYISQGTGTDSARVAKWGIGFRAAGIFPDIFVAFFYTGLGCALFLAGVLFVYGFITFDKNQWC